MASLAPIGCLWIGPRLSFIEKLCLTSMRDQGHPVTLFTYDHVEGVPDGVHIADARDLMQGERIHYHERAQSPAIHSDIFRLHMIKNNPGMIWADTDAYCLKPWHAVDGHFHGWETGRTINTGVLGLPPESETLNTMMRIFEDEYFNPYWLRGRKRAKVRAARAAGTPPHVTELPWGTTGPAALSFFLKKTGEVKYSRPIEALYPVPFAERRLFFRHRAFVKKYITENTVSVHIYGRRVRARLMKRHDGIPPPNSYLGMLAEKHGVTP